MRDLLSSIREGNYDYENGTLDFSCSKIELSLTAGKSYEGSFHIMTDSNRIVTGFVTGSDIRMECLTEDFSGSDIEIPFRFNGEHSEEGDVIKGSFCIISSMGEYYLPYVITIEHSVIESSVGPIKNLFHFVNLSKSNFSEAVRLFYSEDFEGIFTGSDAAYGEIYRALSANNGNAQNVEEFLLHTNKKQKIEYFTSKNEIGISRPYCDSEDSVSELEIDINKNGWGYVALNVECEGKFLFTEKEFISEDDFLGNTYRLPVFVDTAMCGNGVNRGKVYLFNSYVSLEVEVEVQIGHKRPISQTYITRKKLIIQLMNLYQDFKLKKISSDEWLKSSGRMVERLVAMNSNDIEARLFQAQILITEERYNEAGWMLDHVADLIENRTDDVDAMLAYHWYLITLIHTEDEYVQEALQHINRIYRKNKGNWRAAWLLMYMSEEYEGNPLAKWSFLERIFNESCMSPIIYLEALSLINNNPPLVRKLDGFELQVINYGIKNDALSTEVVEQLIYLCNKKKEFSALLLAMLKILYNKSKDNRILQEICTQLIKGGQKGHWVSYWYSEGISSQLRITNIYEYYMMSVDIEELQDIPTNVLLYFSYQNNLDWERSAYLYHFILENKERIPKLYAAYLPQIESFVIDQIQKGRINRHLAAIYGEMLTDAMINAQTAENLSQILFSNLVTIEDERIRKVYVYHANSKEPAAYQINNGSCVVSIYGNDYTIALEDAYGNIFTDSVEYSLEKLMLPGRYINRLSAFVEDNIDFKLYLVSNVENKQVLENFEAEKCLDLILSNCISERLKIKLCFKLLGHYYENDDMKNVDICLESILDDKLTSHERGELLRYLIAMDKFDTAYEWIRRYGPGFADVRVLLKLMDELIPRSMDVEDRVVLNTAYYLFSKCKYDSAVLSYLVKFYAGRTKEMRDIWNAAKAFDVDARKLCERMLVQMIFTGAFVGERIEIFEAYIYSGAKEEVVRAFLTGSAYDYFVRERVTERLVFDEIRNMYLRGEEVKRVCKLAYLKYFAENREELNEDIIRVAEDFLREMLAEKIHLSFFREYSEFKELMQDMEDKTIIEYRAHPGAMARIHYVAVKENGDSGEYLSEYMREVSGGVCFKEFVLFFGEKIQYYIMEEKNGEEQLTESGTIQKNDDSECSFGSRFDLINDMVVSKTMQDYDTLDGLMEEYFRREYFNGELFKLE